MTREQDQPTNGGQPYTGRVLPGSRWRQRAYSGHSEQEVTVLRVGARSVMLVIEGKGALSGHDRQKVGQRFNVLLDTFLKTHTLIEQPKGYRPGDEALPQPRKDTVETYFRRRRFAQEFIDDLSGENLSAVVLDPKLPITAAPHYEGDAILRHPVVSAEVARRVEQALSADPSEPTPPPEEEPIPVTDETTQPQVITATEEELLAAAREIQADLDKEAQAEALAVEPDPLETFLASGRAVVEKLTRELIAVADERDKHLALAEALDARYQVVKANRNRIETAVLAAMGATEGPDLGPAEPVEEPPLTPAEQAAETVVELLGPQAQAARQQRHGPLPALQGTQRSWTLDRLARDGRLHVGSVADEFAAHFKLSRESAIKNMASILGDQVNRPNPQWPTALRVGKGEYTVILNG